MGAFAAGEAGLARWEQRRRQLLSDELETSNWGLEPHHIARVSIWWLVGVAWIAVEVAVTDSRDRWAFVAALALFAAGYAAVVLLPRRAGTRQLALLVTCAVCVTGPLMTTRSPGLSYLAVISAMAAVVGFPLGRAARSALLAVVALTAACTLQWGLGGVFDATSSALLGGVVLYSLHTSMALLAYLREAREERARTAVAAERLRFARDLHDLLGHSLSTIVVQAEVARRLAPRNPEAAAHAASDIETVGRAALVEVRQAVSGYREQTLADELSVARHSLRAAGIDLVADVPADHLPPAAEAVLVWAVREATTNVVRHSAATTCHITSGRVAGGVRLTVRDDGATVAHHEPGNGLRGLRERVDAVGGRLHTASGAHGFSLDVVVPSATDAAPEADPREDDA